MLSFIFHISTDSFHSLYCSVTYINHSRVSFAVIFLNGRHQALVVVGYDEVRVVSRDPPSRHLDRFGQCGSLENTHFWIGDREEIAQFSPDLVTLPRLSDKAG